MNNEGNKDAGVVNLLTYLGCELNVDNKMSSRIPPIIAKSNHDFLVVHHLKF